MDKILIFDFGSQTTQLIARRIRDVGVYTEILPGDAAVSEKAPEGVKGVVFSGSPHSVYEKGAPAPDTAIYAWNLPILGICYGFHRIVHDHGGLVEALGKEEYGKIGRAHV